MIVAQSKLGGMLQDWIAEAMNSRVEPLSSLVAKSPEGEVFATVSLVEKPEKNFSTAAIFLGMPVGVLLLFSFNYPLGFVGVTFLFFNVWSASRSLARIEVEGGSWWYANRSTIWKLMNEEFLLLIFQALAIVTFPIFIIGAGLTLAYCHQVYRIQRLFGKKHLAEWMRNAVVGLERDHPYSLKTFADSAKKTAARIPEVPDVPSVTSAQLSNIQARMETDFDRLSTLEPFDTERPELVKAWKDSNTEYLDVLLREGDKQTRNAWKVAIGIFNAAKDDVDLARGGLRQSVTAAEAALAAYTIDEASIIVARSGTLEGAMIAARLAPKTFTQQLRFDRGVPMAMTKVATGNMPWQAAAAFAAASLVMMAVNHSKLMRQLKELEGQLVEQAEAVRGDITLIESELCLRMVPQFDGLAALFNRLNDGLAKLCASERLVGIGKAKAEAFHLACAVREAHYLLEMKAGN